jgi:hypothetical protein
MKLKVLYLFFALHISIYISSQNVVPNCSFENYTTCSYGLIDNATPWCSINPCSYLNTCISDTVHSIPSQSLSPGYPSYQIPHSGNAYASFGFIWPTITANSRYPHVKLTDTLKAGKIYCVTYYVSLWNDCKYSADKMGALLTATPFNCTVTSQNLYTGYTPQVVSPTGYLYNDTLNWQEVSGSFTAVGNEAYLTIGNFFPNAAHTYSLSYPNGVRLLAEYYLDDVSVEEVEIAKTRNDTLIMQGDSAIIGNNLNEAALFSWQPTAGLSCANCPNPIASPSVTTTYTVTKTQCKAVTSDVITVSVSPTGIAEAVCSLSPSKCEAGVKILPNPTNGLINIDSRFEMQRVEITNVAGQLLLLESTNEKMHQINLNNFSDGIYFLRISYPNGLSTAHKVIINH